MRLTKKSTCLSKSSAGAKLETLGGSGASAAQAVAATKVSPATIAEQRCRVKHVGMLNSFELRHLKVVNLGKRLPQFLRQTLSCQLLAFND
jgi:hypothetical protein